MAENEAAAPVEPAQPAQPANIEAKTVEDTVAEIVERDPNRVYTQDEFDRITARVRKNERYRTKKEIEAYYQGRESIVPQRHAEAPAPAPAQVEQAPQRDQFDSYEDYLRADARFVARQETREERNRIQKEEAQKKEQQTAAERIQTFQGKVREKYPDIDQRLEDVGNRPMFKEVQEAISESEFGPDILSDLINNPAEFDRLAKMSTTSAVREIGKMEARLEATAKAASPADPKSVPVEVKTPSNLPTPIKPIISKTVVGTGEPSLDNPEAWAKWRNQQIHSRKAGANKPG